MSTRDQRDQLLDAILNRSHHYATEIAEKMEREVVSSLTDSRIASWVHGMVRGPGYKERVAAEMKKIVEAQAAEGWELVHIRIGEKRNTLFFVRAGTLDAPAPSSVADQLRALILSLVPEVRATMMHNLGICLHCFEDVRQPDGVDRECHCWNDE